MCLALSSSRTTIVFLFIHHIVIYLKLQIKKEKIKLECDKIKSSRNQNVKIVHFFKILRL